MSRVRETAAALTRLSLDVTAGDYLGGEEELIERLAVSRPTLRQAAKIVEADCLIEVRRGARGGFYAARPEAATAIRTPARYLRLQGATLRDVHRATRPLIEEVGAAAAASRDPALRTELTAFRARIDEASTSADMIRSETELARLLARMSGNPAAELFIEISYTFGREEQRQLFYRDDADRLRARALQRRLVDAVLEGDVDIARLMIRRRSDMVEEWLGRTA